MTDTTVRIAIQGSAAEPYVSEFTRDGPLLSASCTCPAGQHRSHCKHRIGLLSGNTKGLDIIDGDSAAVPPLLPGSNLEPALAAYLKAESAMAAAKKELDGRKKALARMMEG